VSADEVKRLTELKLRPGDADWEALGICAHVTIPRLKAAITGLTDKGNAVVGTYGLIAEDYIENEYDVFDPSTGKKVRGKLFKKTSVVDSSVPDSCPMADGFEENAVFYDLKYLEPSVITANLAFDEIAPLLWMRAGSVGPIITLGDMDPEDATFEVTDSYGVLFDYAWAPEFIEECHERDVNYIFVVTDVDRQYRDMCAEFRGKDVKQLYKSYLRSFEIGQDR
jgi:adenine-specific DNA-methyltransferase